MLRDLFLLTPLREGRRCCRSLPRPTAYPFLLTPLREGRRDKWLQNDQRNIYFYSRPCGRGDIGRAGTWQRLRSFLLTPLREGRLALPFVKTAVFVNFYSRPCGRGDAAIKNRNIGYDMISTHAPAGGATCAKRGARLRSTRFLLTPLREGRQDRHRLRPGQVDNFYSRPCGRGDRRRLAACVDRLISTHAPAGGATRGMRITSVEFVISTHATA